jgi:hypothetical protein
MASDRDHNYNPVDRLGFSAVVLQGLLPVGCLSNIGPERRTRDLHRARASAIHIDITYRL